MDQKNAESKTDLNILLSLPLNHISTYERLLLKILDTYPANCNEAKSLQTTCLMLSETSNFIANSLGQAEYRSRVLLVKRLFEPSSALDQIFDKLDRQFLSETVADALISKTPPSNSYSSSSSSSTTPLAGSGSSDKRQAVALFLFDDILVISNGISGTSFQSVYSSQSSSSSSSASSPTSLPSSSSSSSSPSNGASQGVSGILGGDRPDDHCLKLRRVFMLKNTTVTSATATETTIVLDEVISSRSKFSYNLDQTTQITITFPDVLQSGKWKQMIMAQVDKAQVNRGSFPLFSSFTSLI